MLRSVIDVPASALVSDRADFGIADSGKIRLGGAFRLMPAMKPQAPTADAGAIRLGGAFRLLPVTKLAN